MSDLIDRQAAIDALERKKDKNAKGDISGFYNKIIQNDIDALMQLPPAQLEIVRCKDCVYKRSACMKFLLPTQDDFYCAFGKRRGGDADA